MDHIKIKFNLNAIEISELTDKAIAIFKGVEDKVAAVEPSLRSFETVIEPIIIAENEDAILSSTLTFPQHFSTDKAVRDASSEASKKLSAFAIESGQRVDMFEALDGYVKNRGGERKSPEIERWIEFKLREYRRNGLELPKEKREELAKLKKELSDICIQFAKNLNEVTTTESFTFEELKGMPKDFIEGLKKTEDGKFIVGLKYPEVFPVLNLCSVATTRHRMEFLMNTRCLDTNTVLIEKAIHLRGVIADLLGYKSYADFKLEDRMAKNSTTVQTFLDNLHSQLIPGGKKDIEGLLKLKIAELGKDGAEVKEEDKVMNIWDFRYYHNQLLETEYQVDNEKIKEYFPLDKVTKGMFEIYERLLSLKFSQIDYADIFHEEARMYEVRDNKTNLVIGHFAIDLHPREGKHAAVWGSQKGVLLPNKQRQTPVACMLCNFSKGANGLVLLKHSEVVTYFHEFGHVMHNICTQASLYKFSGTATERDFVEAPSQMLENWCYEKDALKLMSSHYQSGEALPDELIEKMVKAKNANVSLFTLRQLFFGIFDFTLHSQPFDKDKKSTMQLWKDLSDEVFLIASTEGSNGATSFGHIMGGYDCGYYGYLWSDVYSADMFSVFKEKGILSPEIGQRYREHILAPGGSIDGIDLVKNFLGREPSQDAFLKRIGLK